MTFFMKREIRERKRFTLYFSRHDRMTHCSLLIGNLRVEIEVEGKGGDESMHV